MLSTSQVASRLSVHRDTVQAWITEGVRTPTGRVRLHALRVGRRWRVTEGDLETWLQLLNPEVQVEAARKDVERRKRSEAAKRRLGWA